MTLTQEQLKEILNYNLETGEFTWKVKPKKGKVKIGDMAGCLGFLGYRQIKYSGKQYSAHRLAWLYVYGYMPEMLDHINGNRADNRLCNLREVDYSQNNANRAISKSNNTSGYKGVCWEKRQKKFMAHITKNGEFKFLGFFDCPIEAAKAYDVKAKELFGEFAKLNFES